VTEKIGKGGDAAVAVFDDGGVVVKRSEEKGFRLMDGAIRCAAEGGHTGDDYTRGRIQPARCGGKAC